MHSHQLHQSGSAPDSHHQEMNDAMHMRGQSPPKFSFQFFLVKLNSVIQDHFILQEWNLKTGKKVFMTAERNLQ